MAKIKVAEVGELRVVDSLGYVHDVGACVKEVEMPDGTLRKAVKYHGGPWRLWGPLDRTAPLREAVARGWFAWGAIDEENDQ
jgi:hypothetical protein